MLLQVYRQHEGELLNFLKKRLGSTALAEDLAQDLYIKLRRTPEPEALRDGKSYLFSMAANLATDYQRIEQRRRQIREEAQDVVWPSADAITPERAVLARRELAFLEAEAKKLSPRCRKIFYLNRFEGWSQARIAEELGVGLTTVHKDLKNAMATLLAARRRFHGKGPEEDV
ncbi:MAG: RNA polymerase sigma factor [Pseudomonadota bacterium]